MQEIKKFLVRQQLVPVAGRGGGLQAAITPAGLAV